MNEIIRPTLIIDKDTCLRNIEKISQKAKQHKLRFRPHFKTHQSAQIGEWFKMYGVEAITVSSVKMAEYFAANGWNDITIAFSLNVHEMPNINRLADAIKLNVLIENKEGAQVLAEKTTNRMGVYIKIDTGYHRTGIPSSRTNMVDTILETLAANEKVNFKGFLSHTGHTYQAKSTNEIFSQHFDALLKLKTLKRKYEQAYPNIEISMGDTPSVSLCGSFTGVDEIRPGNFVFYDLKQFSLGVCEIDDIAARMYCPVVAKHSSRNEVIIYGGAVHFSKDHIINIDGKPMYGRILLQQEGEKKLLDTKNYISSLSQEHGTVKVTPQVLKQIQIGDWLEILPIHSCLTANVMGYMQTSEGEILNMMPKY